MIGRLNHIAIAVPNLEKAANFYKHTLGANVSDPDDLHEHGVRVVFVGLPNTKIELLHPLDETSPIARFLEKNPAGGMHHVCYEVADIYKATKKLEADGMRLLGNPKIGAHGNLVIFLHPKDSLGTLVELEQI